MMTMTQNAITNAAKRNIDLVVEIKQILTMEKPPVGQMGPGHWTSDWQPVDQAAMLVRSVMGSDFPHTTAKSIVRELETL